MAKLDEQLETLFNEWLDNIEKEIDLLKRDNIAKAKQILALRDVIRENENELDAIKVQIRTSAYEMPDIERKVDYARDYAAYVVDIVNKIEDYCLDEDDDEDDEPIAYCDNCGAEIGDEDEIVYGEEGEYCCDECREEAEGEEDEDIGEDDSEVSADTENEASAE